MLTAPEAEKAGASPRVKPALKRHLWSTSVEGGISANLWLSLSGSKLCCGVVGLNFSFKFTSGSTTKPPCCKFSKTAASNYLPKLPRYSRNPHHSKKQVPFQPPENPGDFQNGSRWLWLGALSWQRETAIINASSCWMTHSLKQCTGWCPILRIMNSTVMKIHLSTKLPFTGWEYNLDSTRTSLSGLQPRESPKVQSSGGGSNLLAECQSNEKYSPTRSEIRGNWNHHPSAFPFGRKNVIYSSGMPYKKTNGPLNVLLVGGFNPSKNNTSQNRFIFPPNRESQSKNREICQATTCQPSSAPLPFIFSRLFTAGNPNDLFPKLIWNWCSQIWSPKKI